MELNFLSTDLTDEDLLLQLVYGLGRELSNPEKEAPGFVNTEGIPSICVRRIMKLLIKKCQLPVPVDRADDWIKWHQNNQRLATSRNEVQTSVPVQL